MYRKPFIAAIIALVIASTLLYAQGSGAIASLVGRTDDSKNLYVRSVAAGAAGSSRNIGNLVGRTDANKNLYVTFDGSSSQTVGTMLAADGTSGAPAYSFASEPTLGFWRSSATNVTLQGSLTSTGSIFATSGNVWGGSVIASGNGSLMWDSRARMTSPADGQIVMANAANTDFSRLMFGGTTSAFPALRRSGNAILVRVADDTTYAPLVASSFQFTGALNGPANVLVNGTAPTVTSAGTSPSVLSNNGTASFRVNVGTGGTATTIVMAMPAAAAGWNCNAENITANAANRAGQRVVPQSSTTTAVTVQNQTIATGAALAFTASDTVQFICFAY